MRFRSGEQKLKGFLRLEQVSTLRVTNPSMQTSNGDWPKNTRDPWGGFQVFELVRLVSFLARLKDYLAQMFSQTVGVHDYFDYICDMRYLDEEENEECYKRGRLLSAAPPPVAVEAIDFAEVDHENTGPKYVQIHPAMLGSLIGCLLITTGFILYLFVRSRAASKDVYLQMP